MVFEVVVAVDKMGDWYLLYRYCGCGYGACGCCGDGCLGRRPRATMVSYRQRHGQETIWSWRPLRSLSLPQMSFVGPCRAAQRIWRLGPSLDLHTSDGRRVACMIFRSLQRILLVIPGLVYALLGHFAVLTGIEKELSTFPKPQHLHFSFTFSSGWRTSIRKPQPLHAFPTVSLEVVWF